MAFGKLKLFLGQHPIPAVLIALTVIGTIVDALKGFSVTWSAVEWLIRKGTSFDAVSGIVSPAPWFGILFIIVLAVTAISPVLYWYASIQLAKTQAALSSARDELAGTAKHSQERSAAALRTLSGMISAASRIRQQNIPTSGQATNSFTEVTVLYLIHKDFTASVSCLYKLRATDGPIHFWEYEIGAEPQATRVDYLLDLNFQVKDESPHGPFEIAYLQSQNEQHYKKIVLYFLPLILAVEPEPRTILVSYKWPGYFLRLNEKLEETFSHSFKAKDKIGSITFEFYLEPGTGKELTCKRARSLEGVQSLAAVSLEVERGQPPWRGHKYCIKNAPPCDYGLLLELKTI